MLRIKSIRLRAPVAFKFEPFSRKQKKLMWWWDPQSKFSDYDIVIADGSVRSGKTIAMICGFMTWSFKTYKGQDFIIAGRSIGALKRNVIKPLRQILRAWGIEHEYNRSENFITSGGNTYYFFGANNEASQDVVQGMTAAGALADEAALLPQSFVEQMIARCSVDGAKIWFNCNPKGQLHWFKQDYIDKRKDKRIYYLQFRLDDNLTLSKRKKEMYKRQFTGVFYSRNILGEWVAASGRIYDMISSGDTVPATGRKYSKYYVSIDYGTQNPMAYGLWGLNGGTWYKCDEYHYDGRKTQRQKTDAEYYDDLVAFANGRPITAVIVDPSAASFITAIRKGGLFTVKKAKNDVVDGIRCTSTAIQNGRIKFTDACPETMKEFETYVWDDAAREKGKEQPLKVNDHHMDETRYFVYTILRREGMNSWT